MGTEHREEQKGNRKEHWPHQLALPCREELNIFTYRTTRITLPAMCIFHGEFEINRGQSQN